MNARPRIIVGKVESGIPIPESYRYSADGETHAAYPFAMMMPGDSFETDSPSIGMVAKTWVRARNLDWKFSVRYMGAGRTRIWRVK